MNYEEIIWSYTIGWDLAALHLLINSGQDGRLLVGDIRHLFLYHSAYEWWNINNKPAIMGYPAGMTRGKNFTQSLELIKQFLDDQGIQVEPPLFHGFDSFTNLEHGLVTGTTQVAHVIEGNLPLALHSSNRRFDTDDAERGIIKENILSKYQFAENPLIAVGAHGKSTTLKVSSMEDRQQLAASESVPLNVIADVLTGGARSGMPSYFFSVDYRDPQIVNSEIKRTQEVYPNVKLARADINHDSGNLEHIPLWYGALKDIADDLGGVFCIITNRSSAAHYGALMSLPMMVLGPMVSRREWDRQANALNSNGHWWIRVSSISGDTWGEVAELGKQDLQKRITESRHR